MRASPVTGHATAERILDAAEALFAQRGYYGVSVREIADTAGAEFSLARYHFGSKDDLFVAVTGRRSEAMRIALLAALDDVEREHQGKVPLTNIVEAYTRAFDRLSLEPTGWHNYLKLIIHSNSLVERPELLLRQRTQYQPVFERYVAALCRAGLKLRDASWCMHSLHATTAQLAVEAYSVSELSGGLCDPGEHDEFVQHIVRFVTAGLEGFARTSAAAPAKAKRRHGSSSK